MDDNNEATTNTHKVIIIGAGAAGIAAATRLRDHRIADFIILEAEDRIGGRIHTANFANFPVDLGAQYCHGEDGNVVYDMVKDLGVLESERGGRLYTPYHSSRKHLDESLFDELFGAFDQFFYEEKEGEEGTSFGDYMVKKTRQFVQEKYHDNNEDVLKTALEALNTYQLDLLANEGAFSWSNVAVVEDYEEIEGEELLGWKGRGFKTILDVLTKTYPEQQRRPICLEDKIFLDKTVTKISLTGNNVTVTSGWDESYTADHVIFTPSLGVLKERYHDLFEPALPGEKIAAISSIGMDSVLKIVYYFPVEWWHDDNRDFTFVWSEEDRGKAGKEFPSTVLENGKSWLPDVLQLIKVPHTSNLLLAWITGENVPQLENYPEEKIIEGTALLLDKFLGHLFPLLSKASKILRASWYANPNFRGVYSYQTLQSRAIPGESQEKVLGMPVKSSDGVPRVLFAGEATSPTHYGTVHGAIETGWREADRIIKLYEDI